LAESVHQKMLSTDASRSPKFPFTIRKKKASKGATTGAIYLVSRWGVCLRQNLQYLLNSSLSAVVRLFFVVV
jgi:hypothetical protein